MPSDARPTQEWLSCQHAQPRAFEVLALCLISTTDFRQRRLTERERRHGGENTQTPELYQISCICGLIFGAYWFAHTDELIRKTYTKSCMHALSWKQSCTPPNKKQNRHLCNVKVWMARYMVSRSVQMLFPIQCWFDTSSRVREAQQPNSPSKESERSEGAAWVAASGGESASPSFLRLSGVGGFSALQRATFT